MYSKIEQEIGEDYKSDSKQKQQNPSLVDLDYCMAFIKDFSSIYNNIIIISTMQEQVPYYSGTLPIDNQGYTVSFDINNLDYQKAKEFYAEYGLIVFDNILDQMEIQATINDLWTEVQTYDINRYDIGSWDNFEMNIYLSSYGFVGKRPIDGQQVWRNRSHKNVYKAFKKTYEISSGETIQQPLLALFDRGSILRPSKLNPDWKTQPIPHFDINPWQWTKVKQVKEAAWRSQNQYGLRFQNWLGQGCFVPKVKNWTKLQGVLALSATNLESGGFQVVCGFHNHIQRWARNHEYGTYVGDCKDLMANMQKIFQRAGSIVIFNRELPHGVYPNISQKTVRYAQYLRMAPESSLLLLPQQKASRRQQVRNMLPADILKSTDPVCLEVYMLKDEQSQ